MKDESVKQSDKLLERAAVTALKKTRSLLYQRCARDQMLENIYMPHRRLHVRSAGRDGRVRRLWRAVSGREELRWCSELEDAVSREALDKKLH